MDWIAGWNKRIKLTISGSCIEGDLSNFPVMVHLDSTCSGVFNELGSNSKRISVVNSEQSQCYVEVERWDESTKNAWLWVKVPTLFSGIDSDLYLYYDNLRPDNSVYVGTVGETPAQNVWDDNFVGVWHMSQDPSVGGACIKDSTGINDGTPAGSMVSGDLVDGKVGKALDFDGNNDVINCGNNSSLDLGSANFTLEAILYSSVTNSHYSRIMSNYDGAASTCFVGLHTDGSNNADLMYRDADLDVLTAEGSTNIENSAFHYIVGIRVADVGTVFVDGFFDGTTTVTSIGDLVGTRDWTIGAARDSAGTGYSNHIKAVLEEIRISNIARSASWIKATYYSNWNTLLTYGSSQDYTPPPDYYYHGYVKEKGTYVTRKVYLYKRDTGLLIDSCMSNTSTGYYLLETSVSGEHFIVVLDDDAGDTYNALIEDRLYPNDK